MLDREAEAVEIVWKEFNFLHWPPGDSSREVKIIELRSFIVNSESNCPRPEFKPGLDKSFPVFLIPGPGKRCDDPRQLFERLLRFLDIRVEDDRQTFSLGLQE